MDVGSDNFCHNAYRSHRGSGNFCHNVYRSHRGSGNFCHMFIEAIEDLEISASSLGL
ncbi:hypothetical protein Bpfe_019290, partial [Biomphalaria pfeifferi]